MNTPLYNQFKTQISSLKGFGFQDFVTQLYLLKYGSDGFLPPRKVQDMGSDGIILNEKRVIACYGPDKYLLREFFKKAKSDFLNYQENLQSQYQNWTFISNLEVPQEAISKIHAELCSTAPVLGILNILETIFELSTSKQRKLGQFLGIDNEYFSKEYIKEILNDLLNDCEFTENNTVYTKPIYTPKKIALNYSKSDINEALSEYELFIENGVFQNISKLLKGYDDDEQDRIIYRILFDFKSSTTGSFKNRLKSLTENYLRQYSKLNDDEYLFYIGAILFFFFEQCLIGKKTEEEL